MRDEMAIFVRESIVVFRNITQLDKLSDGTDLHGSALNYVS